MKQFKKRTIALVLASVITVVGAFGAENYKNSLMSLKFESGSNGAVNMTLLTKRNYEQTISPVKKDATTYVIMLPETNSKMPSNPELAGDVESVNVRTMPYTTSSKGYTKITIKTAPNAMLTAQKALYIPDKSAETEAETNAVPQPQPSLEPVSPINKDRTDAVDDYGSERARTNENSIHSSNGVSQTAPVDIKKSVKQFEPNKESDSQESINNLTTSSLPTETSDSTHSNDILLLVLAVMLVVALCVYFYIRAKEKMAALVGEQPDFSDDESDKKKKLEKKQASKRKQIKSAIRKLDKMYSQPTKMPVNDIMVEPTIPIVQKTVNEVEPQVDNIVDLDELFQEKTNPSEVKVDTLETADEENSALEDFLSGFSFDESNFLENEEEQKAFDEELYEKFINDKNLKFSKFDIEKIEKLLNSEISDETMKNIESFAVTNPIEKKPSKREMLENFVTTYTVNQNVSFSKDDVDVLNKLMSVELDNDFITDLRTNPNRINEMRQEIEKQSSKPHKSSELLTLNVKDMLPDLSEALKQQGGRKIESNAQPQVVYYSEGYDVSTLSLKDKLPDLSVEINNDAAYESRPSDEVALAESGYEVVKMSISDDLPDLEDALNNPEKYEEKDVSVEVDEEALLKNISNISFKPFYDGSEEFEILNDFDDSTAPTVSDMQEEFNQLGNNFEIVKEEEIVNVDDNNAIDDFESLYDNKFVDFDKKNEDGVPELSSIVEDNDKKQSKIKPSEDAEKLLKLIEEKQAEKQQKQEILKQQQEKVKVESEDKDLPKEEDIKTFIVDNEIFEIVSKSNFTDKLGCYLVKNSNGYAIMGFVGEKVFKIKSYKRLKTEKLQTRASEKLNDGTIRYIVRIGVHKFILNVKDDNMEYVMDLC